MVSACMVYLIQSADAVYIFCYFFSTLACGWGKLDAGCDHGNETGLPYSHDFWPREMHHSTGGLSGPNS